MLPVSRGFLRSSRNHYWLLSVVLVSEATNKTDLLAMALFSGHLRKAILFQTFSLGWFLKSHICITSNDTGAKRLKKTNVYLQYTHLTVWFVMLKPDVCLVFSFSNLRVGVCGFCLAVFFARLVHLLKYIVQYMKLTSLSQEYAIFHNTKRLHKAMLSIKTPFYH